MPPRETRRPLLRPNLLETRSSLGLRTKYRSFEYFLTYLHVKGSRRRSDQVTIRFEQRVRTNTYARVCSKSFVGKTINALRSSVLRQLAFSKAASKERARQKTRQEKKKGLEGRSQRFLVDATGALASVLSSSSSLPIRIELFFFSILGNIRSRLLSLSSISHYVSYPTAF